MTTRAVVVTRPAERQLADMAERHPRLARSARKFVENRLPNATRTGADKHGKNKMGRAWEFKAAPHLKALVVLDPAGTTWTVLGFAMRKGGGTT